METEVPKSPFVDANEQTITNTDPNRVGLGDFTRNDGGPPRFMCPLVAARRPCTNSAALPFMLYLPGIDGTGAQIARFMRALSLTILSPSSCCNYCLHLSNGPEGWHPVTAGSQGLPHTSSLQGCRRISTLWHCLYRRTTARPSLASSRLSSELPNALHIWCQDAAMLQGSRYHIV